MIKKTSTAIKRPPKKNQSMRVSIVKNRGIFVNNPLKPTDVSDATLCQLF